MPDITMTSFTVNVFFFHRLTYMDVDDMASQGINDDYLI